MIPVKTWKEYIAQRTLRDEMRWKFYQEQYAKQKKAWDAQRAVYVEDCIKRGALIRVQMFEAYPFIAPPATMEECLNWMAKGKPTIAKKLVVTTA